MQPTGIYVSLEGAPADTLGVYVELSINRGETKELTAEFVARKGSERSTKTETADDVPRAAAEGAVGAPPPKALQPKRPDPEVAQPELLQPSFALASTNEPADAPPSQRPPRTAVYEDARPPFGLAANNHSIVVAWKRGAAPPQHDLRLWLTRYGEPTLCTRTQWLSAGHPYLIHASFEGDAGALRDLPQELLGKDGEILDRVKLYFQKRSELTAKSKKKELRPFRGFFNHLDLQTMADASHLWTQEGSGKPLSEGLRDARHIAIRKCHAALERRMRERYDKGRVAKTKTLPCGLLQKEVKTLTDLFGGILRTHFAAKPRANALAWEQLDDCFAKFARRELYVEATEFGYACEPDSAFFLFFAEFADLAHERIGSKAKVAWARFRALLVACIPEYGSVYHPDGGRRFHDYNAFYFDPTPDPFDAKRFAARVKDNQDEKVLARNWKAALEDLFERSAGPVTQCPKSSSRKSRGA